MSDGTWSLLVVEDVEADYMLLERHLRREAPGARCHWVSDATALVAALDDDGWDAALLDYNVPGMGFAEAVALIRSRRPEVPILLVSGSVGEEHAVELLKQGVADFVLKDSLARLVPAMERARQEATAARDKLAAEEALRASEARLRAVFHGSPVAIGVSRLDDSRFVDCNEAFLRLFGFAREDVIGRTAVEMGIWADLEQRGELLSHLITAGGGVGIEAGFRLATGEVANLLLSAEVIEFGGVPCLLGMVLDDTERRKAEAAVRQLEGQLLQAQKMEAVGRLAGGIAHDFNNMLSVILGYAELVLADRAENDPVRADLEEVIGAAQRSADLTRQLLAFSRQQVVSPRALDLNARAQEMSRLLQRVIGEDITLDFGLDPALWLVYIDPTQMDQVLANLSVNSRDAMPHGGRLTVSTTNVTFDEAWCRTHHGTRPGDHVLLTVGDTGCGMDAATLEHVFEPFFTTKPEGEGTGLGLATVYGVVKQNDGFIDIASEPGRGTTVRIYLPRHHAEAPGEARVAAPAASVHGTETILVVEDQQQVRRLATRLLRQLGYQVLEAAGPTAALAIAESHAGPIDLLLADLVMPEMNGLELSEWIAAARPGIRILFMSGYPSVAARDSHELTDASHLLQKPFDLAILGAKVREALDPQGQA